jgi:solute carrier family 13 (sodium-dependent dicarboxylate transporter), member 2/3/5
MRDDGEGAEKAPSPREERFERLRNTVGLVLGPLAAAGMALLPLPALGRPAHTLAAVMVWVVVWWITEPIPLPVTAVMGATLAILLGVAPARTAFAAFADPMIFLFLGSFILAEAMAHHRLDQRFAYGIMSLRWVGDRSGRILFAFGAICAFISMWISNTATCAMMFPIGLGIVRTMAEITSRRTGRSVDPKRLRFATAMMLMASYASSAGGVGTPVGTPPNLIGISLIEKFTKIRIPFFKWMLFAVPLLIVMYVVLFFLMYALHKPEEREIGGGAEYVKAELAKLGAWTRGQKISLAAFATAVVLWTAPGFIALIWGARSSPARFYNARVPEAAAALIAALLLFVLPVDWKKREFAISWKEAVRIDWGVLLLYGGGIAFGELMIQTKLADAVGQGLLNLTGAHSQWGITLAAVFIAILVSEAASNTASANMVVPVIISLAMAAGVNPLPPAIGATLGASWGFMLPVSTAPNAMVYGSGMVPITKMIRAGVLFDLLGGLIIWLGLRLLLPIVGLA